jgi:hypothetical protein
MPATETKAEDGCAGSCVLDFLQAWTQASAGKGDNTVRLAGEFL